MDIQQIALDEFTMDAQTRAELRPGAVRDYAELIERGTEMDPAVAFDDGKGALRLLAGYHRAAAFRQAGRDAMPCIVRHGTKWDAVKFGIADNAAHKGERPSAADKRHNVKLVLQQQPGLSYVAIADLCGVSDKTVAGRRAFMESTSEIPRSPRRIGRDGRTINVEAAGTRPQSPPSAPVPPESQTPAEDSPGPVSLESPPPALDLSDAPGTPTEPYQPEADVPAPATTKSTTAPPNAPVRFNETERLLGAMKRNIDGMGRDFPGPNYSQAIQFLDKVGEVLANWRGEEV